MSVTIIVSGLAEVPALIARRRPSHLVTLLDPATMIETPDGLSSDRHLQCAQLDDSAYEAAGLRLFNDGRLPGAVCPGSFIPVWQQHGWWPANGAD